ncbi:MAG: HigA family addiction module antitoxin [Treponema sp.]|nr:HigA family addiction module antitoxin [Treponema sp.]
MPKTTNPKNPAVVLQSFIDKYEINPFIVSKALDVAYQSVANILKGKARITVSMALRLAAYFGNTPQFWLDIQNSAEIEGFTSDSKFMSALKKIPKASKPVAKEKKEVKTGKKKLKSLSEKRKVAAKAPGAKKPKGKRAGRPAKK